MNSRDILIPCARSRDAGTISIPNFLDPSQWGPGMIAFLAVASVLAYSVAKKKRWV